MKKEHTNFITGLLTNSKLTTIQRDKVVELALRDLSKNDSEERILRDLELIKENLGIKVSLPKEISSGGNNSKKGSWIDIISENDLGQDNSENFTRNGNYWTTPVKEKDIKKFYGDNQDDDGYGIAKEDTEESQPVVKTMTTEEIEKKLVKVMDPELVVKDNNLKYYYPSGLYKYLFKYNQNPILRSTCHEIDSNELVTINKYCDTETYHFEKHLNKILEAFNEHDNLFAPPQVKALIRGYLTGMDFKGNSLKSGWSSDGIKFSWSSTLLKDWCEKNKKFPPCPDSGLIEKNENVGFEFSEAIKSKTFNKYIKTFNDLVIHFKYLFHIRQDNSLKGILMKQNEFKKWNDQIDFKIQDENFPTNIELFTDIDKLIQAYNTIIELILERKADKKPSLKLSFYQTDNGVELSIHHLNTTYHKSLVDAIERPLGGTYSGLIKNQLNGMCNFYVLADFGQQQFAKINIWNEKARDIETLEFFKGVEHILEFRKK